MNQSQEGVQERYVDTVPSQFDDRYDSAPATLKSLRVKPAPVQQPGVGGFWIFVARLIFALLAVAIAVYALRLAS